MYSVQFLLLLSNCSKSWQAQLQLQIHWAPPLQRTGGCQTWCLTVELKWLWVLLFERLDGSRATCRMGKSCRKPSRLQGSSSKQLLTTGNVKGCRQSNGPAVTGKTWLRFVFGPEKRQILVLPARGHSLHVGCCSSLSTLVSQM